MHYNGVTKHRDTTGVSAAGSCYMLLQIGVGSLVQVLDIASLAASAWKFACES